MPKSRFSKYLWAALAGLALGAGNTPVKAQNATVAAFNPGSVLFGSSVPASEGETIQDIRVQGTQRLEPETVTSYLTVAKGDQATTDKLDASLKALYATGLFADISLEQEGSTLNVNVVENPIINRVSFEGNEALEKEELEKEVQAKPRLVYTLPRVQRDVQRILDLYRRSGRFGAVVEPKIVKLEQNRVDLIFEITEGERTGVRSIKFIGNANYDPDELQQVISTKESAWYKFFSSTDYYDPDRLSYDKEQLRKFYLAEGYVDFRVLSAVAELTPERDDFFLTFTIEEGPRYKFGKIDLKTDIKGLNTEWLKQYLTTQQGNWYSSDQVDKTIAKLTTALGDMQYAFVNIVPMPERHKDKLTVDLTYDIKQGERVYIGNINITGNDRTMDKVIRREMKLAEGDPFSISKIRKSEQKIKDLGFFESVKVGPADGAQPDRANVKVEVKEKSTGEVAIGAGFSSTDGPLGDFTVRERNFLGKGQDVRFGATISGRTRQIDTSFTEPYFLDRDLSAGVDLFRIQTDNQDLSSYDTDSTGFTFRLGYPFSESLRQRVTYSFHRDTISNVPSDASRFIADQQGTSVTSSIGQELTYDKRDSKLEPTEGFVYRLNTEFAGAGGSRKYIRARTGGTQYIPLADKWILSTTAEVGQIYSLKGPTKINERFFLGDDTLRGFQYAGFGPRATTGNEDALGGNRFARGSVEVTTPTPFPPDLGLKAHLFVDMGVLGDSDESPRPGELFANDESFHMSVGIGVTWQSPFGPVRLNYAEPIFFRSFDKIERISFSFGTKF